MTRRQRHLNKDGLIPAHTMCPFKKNCELADNCSHEGEKHDKDFSCAAARAFDMIAGDACNHCMEE